jgi:hypothetical protein
MLPCLKRLKSPSEAKRDDPHRNLRYSLCITLRRTHKNLWDVCASGSLKGIKASCLARACEATHENVDSPSLRGGRPMRSTVSDETSPKEAKAT